MSRLAEIGANDIPESPEGLMVYQAMEDLFSGRRPFLEAYDAVKVAGRQFLSSQGLPVLPEVDLIRPVISFMQRVLR